MNRPMLALTFLVLMSGHPAVALPPPATDSTTIRDIRGPLPPPGLPPFAGTVLVLIVTGLGLAVTATTGLGRKSLAATSPVQLPAMDDLDELRDAYTRGELSAMHLFECLAGIARSRLVQSDSGAMTSAEVLEAAGEAVPAEQIAVAGALFAVCDRVRFGDCQPDTETVHEAFAAVHLLLHRRPETTP